MCWREQEGKSRWTGSESNKDKLKCSTGYNIQPNPLVLLFVSAVVRVSSRCLKILCGRAHVFLCRSNPSLWNWSLCYCCCSSSWGSCWEGKFAACLVTIWKLLIFCVPVRRYANAIALHFCVVVGVAVIAAAQGSHNCTLRAFLHRRL